MGLFDRLRGKKEIKNVASKKVEQKPTELEKALGGNIKIYEALENTMLLDPRKIEVSMKEASEKASELEKEGNPLRARIWYEIAGGIAIYEGNVEKVKEYFSKCKELSPNIKYSILEDTESTVQKAQEYYKNHSF